MNTMLRMNKPLFEPHATPRWGLCGWDDALNNRNEFRPYKRYAATRLVVDILRLMS